MTHWFAVTGATVAAAAWLYQQPNFRFCVFAPFLVGALFSTIAVFLDKRNVQILQACYEIGGEIEQKLTGKGAIFAFIGHTDSGAVTYTSVLRVAHLGTACVFVTLSIVSAALIN